ncbi:right-handed parallel beta-helix repeat-containing protein [Candidatus Woesearchaeota archaeon]|nr:right-handed parallel beta-helix repeat-containing protein [Candidatus Woesearchaeota archaeon]
MIKYPGKTGTSGWITISSKKFLFSAAWLFLLISGIVSSASFDESQYGFFQDLFKTHMNFFLSNASITKFGLPLTALKVGDRARYAYSNPTEWGYALQSFIAGAERNVISDAQAAAKLNISLQTIRSLQVNSSQNYQGLFYPYYTVADSQGNDIPPRHDSVADIPSIDNGLFFMSLIVVEGWANKTGKSGVANLSRTIRDSMKFGMFLFNQSGKTYAAHVINADTGQRGASRWDLYSDEGGLMSLIEYFSGSADKDTFQSLINSQNRNSASWNGHTVKEAAWFNAMFPWVVRSLAGYKVIGTPYSLSSFKKTVDAHFDYGVFLGVDYPAFSDAMTQVNGVGRFTPPNLDSQVPTDKPAFIVPHALFVPLAILPDLTNGTLANITSKIMLLKDDRAGYYHAGGANPYGFEVVASPKINNTNFTGSSDGRNIFETLSQSYVTLSLFIALQKNNGSEDFTDLALRVPLYAVQVNETTEFLYPENPCPDNDSDGYSRKGTLCGILDCDDSNAGINPGADELCSNGIDDDCDKRIDANDAYCMSGCIVPFENLTIKKNSTLCAGTYYAKNMGFKKDGLSLDCRWANIQYPGYFHVEGKNFITLKNCRFSGSGKKITLVNSSGNSLVNLECSGANGCIILRSGSNDNRIINSSLGGGFDTGVLIEDSDRNFIFNSQIREFAYRNGIYLSNAKNTTIEANNISSNGGASNPWSYAGGIAAYYSNGTLIRNNRVMDNYRYAVYAPTWGGLMIVNNTIVGNGRNGFDAVYINVGENYKITGNNISFNNKSGIYFSNAKGINTISRNAFQGNGRYGIDYRGSPDLDAGNNWWGTSNCSMIDNAIYDFADSKAVGNVFFMPFLDKPFPEGSPEYCDYANLSLRDGWNFVSPPLEPHNKSFASIFAEKDIRIFLFAQGRWQFFLNGSENSIDKMSPMSGFWVKSKENQAVALKGRAFKPFNLTVRNEAIIAAYPLPTPQNVSNLFQNNSIKSVFTFRDDVWRSYIPERAGALNSLKVIYPGDAMFVRGKKVVTLVYNGSSFSTS